MNNFCCWQTPVILLVWKPWRLIYGFLAINIITLFLVIITPFGFPFAENTPQRLLVLVSIMVFFYCLCLKMVTKIIYIVNFINSLILFIFYLLHFVEKVVAQMLVEIGICLVGNNIGGWSYVELVKIIIYLFYMCCFTLPEVWSPSGIFFLLDNLYFSEFHCSTSVPLSVELLFESGRVL